MQGLLRSMSILMVIVVVTLVTAVAKRMYDRKVAVNQIQEVNGTMGFGYFKPEFLRQLVDDEECCRVPLRVSLGPIANDKAELDDEILASVSDALQSFNLMRTLDIRESAITDKSANVLASLTQVSNLRLTDTKISDITIQRLKELPQLRSLSINGTAVTDACVDDLAAMENLTRLYLQETQLSEESILELSKKLPRCKIQF